MPDPDERTASEPTVDVGTEEPTPRGWRWRVGIEWPGGERSEHLVSLSWADHDHLTGGAVAPSIAAQAVAAQVADHLGREAVPRRFDAATARRLVARFDEAVRSVLAVR